MRPSSANKISASLIVLLLQAGSRRSALNQALASSQHLSTLRVSPRGRFQSPHHFAICSSDQKSSIVFQLKTTSSHQRAAATAKWASPRACASEPFATSKVIAVPQHPHEALTIPSCFNMEGIPRASQMQLP